MVSSFSVIFIILLLNCYYHFKNILVATFLILRAICWDPFVETYQLQDPLLLAPALWMKPCNIHCEPNGPYSVSDIDHLARSRMSRNFDISLLKHGYEDQGQQLVHCSQLSFCTFFLQIHNLLFFSSLINAVVEQNYPKFVCISYKLTKTWNSNLEMNIKWSSYSIKRQATVLLASYSYKLQYYQLAIAIISCCVGKQSISH